MHGNGKKNWHGAIIIMLITLSEYEISPFYELR